MLKYKIYYTTILSNLKKNNVFIRYFSKNYTYLDSLNYSLKVLKFFKEKKNQKQNHINFFK